MLAVSIIGGAVGAEPVVATMVERRREGQLRQATGDARLGEDNRGRGKSSRAGSRPPATAKQAVDLGLSPGAETLERVNRGAQIEYRLATFRSACGRLRRHRAGC